MLTAILLARKSSDFDITIIEKNNKLGKKLLATGNGRCNFTNEKMESSCYYSNAKDDSEANNFVKKVLAGFDEKSVRELFLELGLMSKEKDGYVYPYSNQASTVVEMLKRNLSYYKIKVRLEETVEAVEQLDSSEFVVETNENCYHADKLVLACGGMAASKLGGTTLGYRLAKHMGHSIEPCLPALTGYRCKEKFLKAFSGVRIQGTLTLLVDGKEVAKDQGEIQCVLDGISGIPAFQLCHIASKALHNKKKVSGAIDFLPNIEKEELLSYLQEQKKKWDMRAVLCGLVNEKCVDEILMRSKGIEGVCDTLKNFTFSIEDTFGFEKSQVTAGGVSLSELDSETMESKLHKGLYLLGELVDVDGICGGYNLQWAWSTAYACANAISENSYC